MIPEMLFALWLSTAQAATMIHGFDNGLAGVRAAGPDVRLRVDRDLSIAGGPVLIVEYPPPTGNPAGRDVQCSAENQDWTSGRAIAFQIKPDHDLRLSVSFIDRNGVVYTAFPQLKGGDWQPVRIAFDEIRPNPYFQPPGARTGAPIDVSEVKFIAFAPQDKVAGRMAISAFVVAR